MTKASPTKASGADWSSLQLLHKLYSALAQEFSIESKPCSELEKTQQGSPESVAAARAWFAELDGRIAVHQLRQFLQTSHLADETSLQAAAAYALHKPEHNDSDRDKVDFLLVQLFSICAPSLLEDNEVTFELVAATLKSILGETEPARLESLQSLDEIIQTATACRKLTELFASGVIEKGRELKQGTGQNYYKPGALVGFTRFNFLLRRCFFRAMHRDLNAILDGLQTLEVRGVQMLDCRGAELSAEEPVPRLRMICQSWKAMFQAEYSYGQPLRMLVDLRVAVDAALATGAEPASQTPKQEPAPKPETPARTMAAAASGEGHGKKNGKRRSKRYDSRGNRES